MGAKIDRIGERLSPEQLKQQAQESMNEMMTDTANRISAYVRENQRELSDSLVHTLKHNPVPTALIGLGLGWLLVESFSTSSGKAEYGDRYQRRRRDQYAKYADRYDDSGRFGRSYDPRYGTGYYRGSVQAVDAEGYPYEESDFGVYPYAASHGESYDERYEPNFYEPAYDYDYDERAYDSGAYDQWSATQAYNGRSEQVANGRNLGENVRERGRQMRDRAGDMAHEAGDRAQELGENLREGAEDVAD